MIQYHRYWDLNSREKNIAESFSDEWKEMMGREFESILFPEFETANSELLDTYRYVDLPKRRPNVKIWTFDFHFPGNRFSFDII